jgi:hypothetical protein
MESRLGKGSFAVTRARDVRIFCKQGRLFLFPDICFLIPVLHISPWDVWAGDARLFLLSRA